MKTLGDTGLVEIDWTKIPDKAFTYKSVENAIDQLSAIDLLTIVKTAVEKKLVVIKPCPNVRCKNGLVTWTISGGYGAGYDAQDRECSGTEPCNVCSGSGVLIEEGT